MGDMESKHSMAVTTSRMVGMRATITKLKNMPHLKDVQDNGALVCVCSSSKHQGPGNIIVRDALVHVWETSSRVREC